MAEAFRQVTSLVAVGQRIFEEQCKNLVGVIFFFRSRSLVVYNLPLILFCFLAIYRSFYIFAMLQGLPVTNLRPFLVLQAILRCQERIGREFTQKEMQEGTFSAEMTLDDFNYEKHVSYPPLTRIPLNLTLIL